MPSIPECEETLITPGQELVHERARRGLGRLFLRLEILHDVILLLPVVHGLLELGMALKQQHIDRTPVVNIAIALKLLPNLRTHKSQGEIKQVERGDFRSLFRLAYDPCAGLTARCHAL